LKSPLLFIFSISVHLMHARGDCNGYIISAALFAMMASFFSDKDSTQSLFSPSLHPGMRGDCNGYIIFAVFANILDPYCDWNPHNRSSLPLSTQACAVRL
jgi:hypothetical protein